MFKKSKLCLTNFSSPILHDYRYDIMLKCWSEKAARRPTFAELKSTLDKLLLQNNAYIQFSSYAATTTIENPPGYDHLPPPSISVDPSSQTNGIQGQNASHADTKSKPAATRTLSAPLVDYVSSHAAGIDDGGNASSILRSASNSYVETPTAIINSRFQVGGTEGATKIDKRGGRDKRRSGARGAKKVIHQRKRRVNTETRRTAHLRVERVNTVPAMITGEGYDHLDPIKERDCNVDMSAEEYDHFPST